jgi:hypothetical protein
LQQGDISRRVGGHDGCLDEHVSGELDRHGIRGLHDVRGGEHLAIRTDEYAGTQSRCAYFMRIRALPCEDALGRAYDNHRAIDAFEILRE